MDRTLAVGLAVVTITTAVLLALRQPHINKLFRATIRGYPKRRLFLAGLSFFLTFAIARSIAYANFHQMGPFHDIYIQGRHIHHLVWGILLLLGVGYGWLAGFGSAPESVWSGSMRLMALLYGAGAALTLDEFALWLNLEDVYWSREGRASIDAVILFGMLLMVSLLGRGFFTALGREFFVVRRGARK